LPRPRHYVEHVGLCLRVRGSSANHGLETHIHYVRYVPRLPQVGFQAVIRRGVAGPLRVHHDRVREIAEDVAHFGSFLSSPS
jgi:hypothetical protein